MPINRLDMNVSPAIQPHLDLVMPTTAQTVAEIITAILFVLSVCYFVQEAIKTKSYYPVMFFLGAVLAFFAEPIMDIGQTVIMPHVGMHVAVEILGRKVPLYIMMAWFGALPLSFAVVGNYLEKGVDSKTILWTLAAMAVSTILMEIVGIHFGLWSYYGEHRIFILGYPPVIPVINSVTYLLCSVAYIKLKPIFVGSRQVLGILIIPIVFVGSEFGVGWPVYSAVTTARAVESDLFVYTGLLGTLALSAVVIWCVCYAIAVPKGRTD